MNPPDPSSAPSPGGRRSVALELAGAFLLALAVRALCISFSCSDLDSYGYLVMAQDMRSALLAGTFSLSPHLWSTFFGIDHWTFLYSLFTALLSLTGLSLERAALAVSLVAGSLLAPLGYLLADLLWHRPPASRLGALFIALSPTLVWHSTALRNFSLYFLLYLLGVYLTALGLESGKARHYALAGFTWGLAYLTRFEGIAGLAIAVAVLAFSRKRAPCAVLLLCALSVCAPYLLLMHHMTGRWVVSLRYVDAAHFERKVFYETGLEKGGKALVEGDDEYSSRFINIQGVIRSLPFALQAFLENAGLFLLVLAAVGCFQGGSRRIFLLFLLPAAVYVLLPGPYQSLRYYTAAVPLLALYAALGFSALADDRRMVGRSASGAVLYFCLLFSSWCFGAMTTIEGPPSGNFSGVAVPDLTALPSEQALFALGLVAFLQVVLLASHLLFGTRTSVLFTALLCLHLCLVEIRGDFLGISTSLGVTAHSASFLPHRLFLVFLGGAVIFFELFSILMTKLREPERFRRAALAYALVWFLLLCGQSMAARSLIIESHLLHTRFPNAASFLRTRTHGSERIVCSDPLNAFLAGGRWVKPPRRIDEAFLRENAVRYVIYDSYEQGRTAAARGALEALEKEKAVGVIYRWRGVAPRFRGGELEVKIYEVLAPRAAP